MIAIWVGSFEQKIHGIIDLPLSRNKIVAHEILESVDGVRSSEVKSIRCFYYFIQRLFYFLFAKDSFNLFRINFIKQKHLLLKKIRGVNTQRNTPSFWIQYLGITKHNLRGNRVGDLVDYGYTVYPRCSMYGIFTYIWLNCLVNVGRYSVHGAYGYVTRYTYFWLLTNHQSAADHPWSEWNLC